MKRGWFRSLLIILWVLGMISAYYAYHKPIDLPQLKNLAQAGAQVLSSAAIVSVAGGVGKGALRKGRFSPLERMLIEAAVGLGALGLFVLLMGVVIGYQGWLSWGFTAVVGILLRKRILAWLKQIIHLRQIILEGSNLDKLLWLVVGLILWITLLRSLAPPVKYDTLVYHLSLPKRYLQAGKFAYVDESIYWGMPQLLEMLFTWAMALAGPEAAITLGWMTGAVSLIGLFGLVKRRYGQTVGLVAIIALLSGFSTSQSLSWGYTIWMGILLGGAFFMTLNAWVLKGGSGAGQLGAETTFLQGRGELIAAGVFAGLALGAKYSYAVLLWVAVAVILGQLRKKPKKAIIFDALVFAGSALVVFSPWMIKNIAATGNPFYPFVYPSGEMDPFRLSFYSSRISVIESWKAVFLPVSFSILGKEGAPGYAASVGPLLTALGLIGIVSKQRPGQGKESAVNTARLVAVVGFVVWGVAGWASSFLQQTRLYMVIFPALVLLAGKGFSMLEDYRLGAVRVRRVILALVLFVALLNSYQLLEANIRGGPATVVLGLKSEQDYLERNLGWYSRAMQGVRQLPSESRVLLLWEPRSFSCLPLCDNDEIIDRWAHDWHVHGSSEAVKNAWVEQGYTHVLYYKSGAVFIRESDPRYPDDSWAALADTLGQLEMEADFGDVYHLYQLENR